MAKGVLKLFVTGHTSRGEKAIYNFRRLCRDVLKDEYEAEIIDVLENPQITDKEKIIATPTLLKVSPLPSRRVIGDLTNFKKVIEGLGIIIKDLAQDT